MPKILYIITQADQGGAQKYVLTCARHFKASIACGNESNALINQAKLLGLTTYPLKHLKREINLWHDFNAIREIRKLIKTLNPDIVHLNSTKAGLLGSLANIGLSPKTIFTAHGFIYNEPLSGFKKRFYLLLEKLASKFRDYIICVSVADKISAEQHKLIAPHKISTVYNGINSIAFLPKAEAQAILQLKHTPIIIGTIANYYPTKGLDILIQATALLSDEIKNQLQVIIIGDGPEKVNLELNIKNYHLDKYITLLGRLEHASQYLKAYDIFILPSRKEGFPYVILEAMQAGLPIIATNVGGVSEALDKAGIIIEPHNPKTLAQAITRLISDTTQQQKLSQKAQLRAQLFSENTMLAQTNTIYETLLTR